MKNALLLGFFVLLMWSGVEVVTKGVDGAFGGVFAGAVSREPARPPVGERAGGAMRGAYDQGASRVDRQLADAE